jgi:hypothetical protein
MLPFHQFADVSSYLLGMDSTLRGPLGLPIHGRAPHCLRPSKATYRIPGLGPYVRKKGGPHTRSQDQWTTAAGT